VCRSALANHFLAFKQAMLFRLAFTAGGVLAAVTYMRKGALNHAAFLSVAEAAVAAAGGGIGRMIGGLNGARNLLASKSNQPNASTTRSACAQRADLRAWKRKPRCKRLAWDSTRCGTTCTRLFASGHKLCCTRPRRPRRQRQQRRDRPKQQRALP